MVALIDEEEQSRCPEHACTVMLSSLWNEIAVATHMVFMMGWILDGIN
jgi:hypothetical protein